MYKFLTKHKWKVQFRYSTLGTPGIIPWFLALFLVLARNMADRTAGINNDLLSDHYYIGGNTGFFRTYFIIPCVNSIKSDTYQIVDQYSRASFGIVNFQHDNPITNVRFPDSFYVLLHVPHFRDSRSLSISID